jgi:hypothetical protein
MKTLEIETDLMVTGTRSVLDHHEDRVIQRSPGEPDFWFGNRTIFHEAPEDIAVAIATAQADFPDQRFSVISWDVPDLDPSPYKPALEAAGYEIEQGITLAGQQAIRPGLPEGIRFAEIERDEDWDAVITLQTESLIAEGRQPDAVASFTRDRFATRREDSKAGLGAWFGLFDGALLVADMGLVWSERLVRFQSVETRKSHRRRGLCAALLGEVSAVAAGRFPGAQQVIVADSGSAAARLYERAGFVCEERVLSAIKQPKTDTNPV